MKLGELKEAIAFEAGITDIDSLGGFPNSLIGGILNTYTAQVKYDDLFVKDVVIEATPGSGLLSLPVEVQHIDLDNVRYHSGGVSETGIILRQTHRPYLGSGRPRFVFQNATPQGLRQLHVTPTDDIVSGDEFVINYWRLPSVFPDGDDSEIVPAILIEPVKLQAISRLTRLTSSSVSSEYRSDAREAHGKSFGATRLGR